MLVLTRRPDDGDGSVIVIGDHIEVTVLEVRGGQVRLGINAPEGVAVHRKEIWVDIREEVSKDKAPR